MKKVVLTGGPSAGKTLIAEYLCQKFPNEISMVPETATLLFSGGFTRSKEPMDIYNQQRAIYFVQIEHEAILSRDISKKIILCDRGTLDGSAYWPSGVVNFYQSLSTQRDKELFRYDFVFHLTTAPGIHYNRSTNLQRIETVSEAEVIDQKIMTAWEGHPQRTVFLGKNSFAEKRAAVVAKIEDILQSL
ncbi:MAG: ATP-binding protein [Bdellovibrionales bacterium]|nr:ATP-binding protein [Bdellovibrionales bacterium]